MVSSPRPHHGGGGPSDVSNRYLAATSLVVESLGQSLRTRHVVRSAARCCHGRRHGQPLTRPLRVTERGEGLAYTQHAFDRILLAGTKEGRAVDPPRFEPQGGTGSGEVGKSEVGGAHGRHRLPPPAPKRHEI